MIIPQSICTEYPLSPFKEYNCRYGKRNFAFISILRHLQCNTRSPAPFSLSLSLPHSLFSFSLALAFSLSLSFHVFSKRRFILNIERKWTLDAFLSLPKNTEYKVPEIYEKQYVWNNNLTLISLNNEDRHIQKKKYK